MGPFYLPLPPSANNLSKRRFGRKKFIPTPAYKSWQDAAAIMAIEQRIIPHAGSPALKPVHVWIEILPGPGLNRGRDGDNMAKAVQDWLVNHHFLTNDSLKYVTGTHVVLRRRENSPYGDSCIRVSILPDES